MTSQYCKKGSTVAVRARLAARTIDVDGLKIKTVDVIGERVIFINLKNEEDPEEKE